MGDIIKTSNVAVSWRVCGVWQQGVRRQGRSRFPVSK